jgi:malonyl-CoA O-methyltransferase
MAQLPGAQVSTLAIPVLCHDLVGFLDHLRHTGARTAPPGTNPMTTAQMRRLVQMTRGRPLTMTYEILTVLWSRP